MSQRKSTGTKKRGAPKRPAPTQATQTTDEELERIDKVAATITYTEAGALAERLTRIDMDADAYATILLLIAAATYEETSTEKTYYAVGRVLLPEIVAAQEASEGAQITVLRGLRQAGAAQ
ncbi:MAG: hypothetical protein ACJ74W_16915 [Pyrinomonadaceae bacterium]